MCLYIRFCSVHCTLSTWGAWDVVYGVVCFISCSSQNCLMLRLKNSLPLSLQLKNYKIVFFPMDQLPHLHILKVFKFLRAKFQFRFFVFIFTTPSKRREVWIVLKCVNEEKILLYNILPVCKISNFPVSSNILFICDKTSCAVFRWSGRTQIFRLYGKVFSTNTST